MAFNVNFWTFSKKERSTAQPTGQGTVYSCTANEPLDLLAPVISLKLALNTASPPTVYNYARIANFNRYYWVTGWEIRDGLWWASLRVDVLASWKTEIGNNSIYVYRSSAAFSNDIADDKYPTTSNIHRYNITLNKIWTVDGTNAAGTSQGVGTYVLGIISNGWSGLPGVQYYGFTSSNLSKFMDYIFSDDYYNNILTEFGATEYPEAKVAINPLQYVVSARYFPIGYSGTGSGNYLLHGAGSTFVAIASQVITDNNVWCAAFYDIPNTQQHFRVTRQTWNIVPTAGWFHPQSTDRGYWLDRIPYTRIELFFPPFGIIDLDPASIMGASNLAIHLDIDIWTGTATLTIESTISNETRTINKISTQVGLDIPLTNITYNSRSEMATAAGAAQVFTSALSLNLSGVLQGERQIAGSYIDSWTPHLSSTGTQNGSVAPMSGTPMLMFTHQYVASEDNSGLGRPYCSIRQISAIPGFITGDSDEISIPCTSPELTEIKNAISAGFFYE